YGDIITVAVTGNNTLSTGTVEEVTLRTTRIRSLSGEVITTPKGQIVQVTNLSRDWARVVVDVPVPARVDGGHVTSILRQVGRALRARITLVFLREGITLHASLNAAEATGSAG